ncbi:MAG: hypothetical protein M3Q65_14670 [Chloroflexota bacterium]|nr:hypothetical protein [Chloroflexota bacterium]
MRRAARREGDDRVARRSQIEARLARIKELYGWGDLGKAEYAAERDRLRGELETLRDDDTAGALVEALAALLADTKAAWTHADQEQHNRLARLLFQEVRIRDHKVIGLEPTPEFAAFFRVAGCEEVDEGAGGEAAGHDDSPDTQGCSPKTLSGGSDGGQTRGYKLPDTHFSVDMPVALPRPPQQQPQVAPALWAEIAERARYESLRDLAAEYAVSHETIRAVVRRVRDTGAAQASGWC